MDGFEGHTIVWMLSNHGVQDLSWTSQQAKKPFNNLNEEGDKSPTTNGVQDLSWMSQQAKKPFNNLNEEGDKSPTTNGVQDLSWMSLLIGNG